MKQGIYKYKYYGEILRIDVKPYAFDYGDQRQLDVPSALAELKDIVNRVNNYYFKNKNEIIYFILCLYSYVIDGKVNSLVKDKKSIDFDILTSKDRIIVELFDEKTAEKKIMSFYSPFYIDLKNKSQSASKSEFYDLYKLESKFDTNIKITSPELTVLLSYFQKSIFFDFEKESLMKQAEELENVVNDLKKTSQGYADIDLERIEKLVSELQYLDTSYLRYDIDFENSLRVDRNLQIVEERLFYHPPFHIDSDYREKPSYKIAFNKKITSAEFIELFQLDGKTPAKMVKQGWIDKSLINELRTYKNSLGLNKDDFIQRDGSKKKKSY